MGKYSRDPKGRVYSFRVTAQVEELIEEGAKHYRSMSEFLEKAAILLAKRHKKEGNR